MYYIKDLEDNIVLIDESLDRLQSTLEFTPQYKELPILETKENEIIVDFKLMTTDEYEAQKAQQELEELANLKLTGADVERAIVRALNTDFDDVLEMVKVKSPENYKLVKAELKANYFYRGNPYVDVLGQMLGLTKEQLDEFFKTNDYTVLLPIEPPIEPPTETPAEV